MEHLELIKPSSLSTFCGNKFTIKCIDDFLKKTTGEKNMICIIGPDGCGKTTLNRLIFKKHNFNVLEIGKDTLNGEDIKTILNNFAKNNTIDSILNKRTKVVFVDDIDILSNIDKFIMSKLLVLNKLFKEKGIKVFMTCNINDERKIQDNAKDIEIFKMYYPSFKDSYVYIMNVFDEHNIDYDPEQLLHVASRCKGNIREIVLNLNVSTNELETKYDERIFKDLNNFEVAKYVLQQRARWKDIESLSKGDVGLIPHILYENLPDELEHNYKTIRGKKNTRSVLDMYIHVNKCFIDSQQFEESAFCNHEWTMLSYANYLKMHSIQNVVCEMEKKQNVKDLKYKFSQMVSKMSHKNIMNKKIKGISTASNVSNASVIMASDMHATSTTAPTKKSKSSNAKTRKTNNDFNFEEGTSIINTYQKYFT